MADPAPIVATNVSHSYGTGSMRREVLQDINFRVDPGEVVLLTGPSGCGKTTLLTLVGALRSLQHGQLQVLGVPLKDHANALPQPSAIPAASLGQAVSYTHLTLPTKA